MLLNYIMDYKYKFILLNIPFGHRGLRDMFMRYIIHSIPTSDIDDFMIYCLYGLFEFTDKNKSTVYNPTLFIYQEIPVVITFHIK